MKSCPSFLMSELGIEHNSLFPFKEDPKLCSFTFITEEKLVPLGVSVF